MRALVLLLPVAMIILATLPSHARGSCIATASKEINIGSLVTIHQTDGRYVTGFLRATDLKREMITLDYSNRNPFGPAVDELDPVHYEETSAGTYSLQSNSVASIYFQERGNIQGSWAGWGALVGMLVGLNVGILTGNDETDGSRVIVGGVFGMIAGGLFGATISVFIPSTQTIHCNTRISRSTEMLLDWDPSNNEEMASAQVQAAGSTTIILVRKEF